MIHKLGFELQVQEGVELSCAQFIDDLRTVLPKEWWGTVSEIGVDGIAWVLAAIYPLNDDGTLRQADLSLRPSPAVDWEATAKMRTRAADKMQSYLDQERKLTAQLDQQVANLIEKNDNQVKIIKNYKHSGDGWATTVNNLRHELRSEKAERRDVQSQYDESLKDWVRMRDLRNEWVDRYDTQAETMSDMVIERDGLMLTLKSDTETITRLRDDLKVSRNVNLERLAEARVNEEMVQKIIDAMQGAGFDISGWGDDDQLSNLEGSLDDIKSAAAELGDTLGEVRTER